VYIYVCFVIK